MLLTALCVSALASLFAWHITRLQSVHTTNISQAAAESAKQVSIARVHSFLTSTAADRQKLDGLTRMDIVSIVDMIEQAGKTAGVDAQINNVPSPIVSALARSTTLPTLDFIVQAQGTFAQVMKAAAFFQSLPVPSSVQELSFERLPGSGSALWHMSARVRIVSSPTTSL